MNNKQELHLSSGKKFLRENVVVVKKYSLKRITPFFWEETLLFKVELYGLSGNLCGAKRCNIL